jgi:hypothetical protein
MDTPNAIDIGGTGATSTSTTDTLNQADATLPLTETGSAKQTSECKREASRRNGRKSSGPRTRRGKSISRLNAIRHGGYTKLAFAELHHVRGFENANELLADLIHTYPPQTLAESIRLEKLAGDIWREARVTRLEIAATESDFSFCNEWVSRLVSYANTVHKLNRNIVETLAQLDREAQALAREQQSWKQEGDAPGVFLKTSTEHVGGSCSDPLSEPTIEASPQGMVSGPKPPAGLRATSKRESMG